MKMVNVEIKGISEFTSVQLAHFNHKVIKSITQGDLIVSHPPHAKRVVINSFFLGRRKLEVSDLDRGMLVVMDLDQINFVWFWFSLDHKPNDLSWFQLNRLFVLQQFNRPKSIHTSTSFFPAPAISTQFRFVSCLTNFNESIRRLSSRKTL